MTAKKKLNLGDLLSIYAQHRPNSPGVSSPSHPPNPPARSAALTYYPSATQARAGACDEDPIHSEFLNVMTGILSPEVAARFEAACEGAADGDTYEVAPHKETPRKSLGAANLLALFDEPGAEDLKDLKDLKAEPAIPLEFQGVNLKAEQAPEPIPAEFQGEDLKAPRAATSSYRPALALWATCSALALTSAAAFMCGRGSRTNTCGQRMAVVPRGLRRTRRRARLSDDDITDALALVVPPPPVRELFFHKVLRHQDPSMDTTDADAVVGALTARGGRLAEAASAPSVEREPILASFETDYAAASRAHVLDVRAHVLQRVQGALEAQPELDLVDAVEAGAGLGYEHAHERADLEGQPVATTGGFLLNLRAHVLRGADGLLHQNPEMDLDDIVSTKTRVKQAKLASRAISAGR